MPKPLQESFVVQVIFRVLGYCDLQNGGGAIANKPGPVRIKFPVMAKLRCSSVPMTHSHWLDWITSCCNVSTSAAGGSILGGLSQAYTTNERAVLAGLGITAYGYNVESSQFGINTNATTTTTKSILRIALSENLTLDMVPPINLTEHIVFCPLPGFFTRFFSLLRRSGNRQVTGRLSST